MRIGWTIRRLPTAFANALRDLRYGRLLGGTIRTRYAHLGARHAVNSDYRDLAILFAAAEVRADDVIVDVGCGKGRSLNWLLAHHPENRLIGIELDPEICARTAKRLRRHRNLTIRCGDATTILPPEGTLFYLFNPFDETVMVRFREAVAAEARSRARIVYYNAKELHVFASDPRFAVRRLDDPRLTHASAIVDLR
ncbi:MAG TPA: class I SAM-dependent methyltransferase [Gaiellaceae bacterium]|nr:class I SAM-dependent methyltransferase [Gaiellaceae bacterium]